VQHILQDAIVASPRSERQSRPAFLALEYKFKAMMRINTNNSNPECENV
jgi:hypothetical protein